MTSTQATLRMTTESSLEACRTLENVPLDDHDDHKARIGRGTRLSIHGLLVVGLRVVVARDLLILPLDLLHELGKLIVLGLRDRFWL